MSTTIDPSAAGTATSSSAEMPSIIVPLAMAFFAVRCATRATVGAEECGHLDTLRQAVVRRSTRAVCS